MDKCFDCDSVNDIHQHHVVPRSLGGTRTVPLCSRCHGLVHGRDMTRGAVLTRQALAHKRATGRKSNANTPIGLRVAADGETVVVDDHEQRALELVRTLRAAGHSVRGIVAHLTAAGIPPRGARWHPTTINRMLANSV